MVLSKKKKKSKAHTRIINVITKKLDGKTQELEQILLVWDGKKKQLEKMFGKRSNEKSCKLKFGIC